MRYHLVMEFSFIRYTARTRNLNGIFHIPDMPQYDYHELHFVLYSVTCKELNNCDIKKEHPNNPKLSSFVNYLEE